MSSLALGFVVLGTAATTQAQLIFNFTPAAGMSQTAIDGFTAAGNRWSSLFSDNVTVNINIDFKTLGAGILGQAGSAQNFYSYSSVKSALTLDRSSADDNTAVSYLPGSSIPILINQTADNPNGNGSATPFLDNDGSLNNSYLRLSNANAKALGLRSGTNAALDASISFSDAFSWDFDPTNGITAGAFDFIGVATHEIGHALGFISGVDILDYNSLAGTGSTYNSDDFYYVSALDLFRYSALSAASGAIDWTADTRSKYFSIDGGLTNAGAEFSTGVYNGDGRQASHWKDDNYYGIMDPTAARGELLAIGANDVRALDVIGWDRVSVPDTASTLVLLGSGLFGLAFARRRMRTGSR